MEFQICVVYEASDWELDFFFFWFIDSSKTLQSIYTARGLGGITILNVVFESLHFNLHIFAVTSSL